MENKIITKGEIFYTINYDNGKKEEYHFNNTVLVKGRSALASSLANDFGSSYDFYISRMIFGDGGTNAGVPKYVQSSRTGLFGITRASKPVIATIDPTIPSQVTFTAVLDYGDAVGNVLSEMALRMNNGDLYSMATFPDLSKTSSMSIIWNWQVSFM